MKLSTSWIKEHLCRTMSDKEIVQALEQAGIEIEQYITSNQIDKRVVVGLVNKCVQHPGADRLRIAEVQTGEGTCSIVCGAPNVREGLKVAVAQVGTTLPDGTVIKKSKLRGETSEGMLCSEVELGLGSDHNGLLELGDEAEVGTPLCDMYENHGLVDVKTAANRPDLQSVIGLAREVAAIADIELKQLVQPAESGDDGPKLSPMNDPMLAPRFMMAELELGTAGRIDTVVHETMAMRLRESGVRPISTVVDITNYVMLEYGQPLHAYDADKVTLPIGVRLAEAGETIVTLDGVERSLSPDDMVIADKHGPIGLAGVMGGLETEVSEQTTRIYLEAATFDGSRVRKSAKRHGLRSEASARFERGLPVQLAPFAAARAIELLGKSAGAKIIGGISDELRVWPWTQRIGLKLSALNRLLGYELTRQEACEALARLGIEAVPFDIVAQSRSHLGKPYVWGASFKKNGTDAFDCSYFTDYLYSLIGQRIGYTSLAQFEIGTPVDEKDLQPGDILFYEGKPAPGSGDYDLADVTSGKQDHSITGHYYLWSQAEGRYVKVEATSGKNVGHNGLYVGGGRVVHAAKYQLRDGKWQERAKPSVVEDDVSTFTENPGYLGARRFVKGLDEFISVPAAPWWRPDLKLAEDLVEEIVRILGYDRVPSTLPAWRPLSVRFDQRHRNLSRLKQILSGAGLFEVMTYSFVGRDNLEQAGLSVEGHLKLKNPLSGEQEYLRTSLLPSHLQVLERNRNYARELGFYEISKVFVPTGVDIQPSEPLRLGIMVTRAQECYRTVKGMLDLLAREFNVELSVAPAKGLAGLAPGRSGRVMMGRREVGTIGQLDPVIVAASKVSGQAAWLELDADALLEAAKPPAYRGLAKFPGTSRDITLTAPVQVSWGNVEQALKGLHHTQVAYVSEYADGGMTPGYRNLTVRLTLSYPDRTPMDEEAGRMEAQANKILTRLLTA